MLTKSRPVALDGYGNELHRVGIVGEEVIRLSEVARALNSTGVPAVISDDTGGLGPVSLTAVVAAVRFNHTWGLRGSVDFGHRLEELMHEIYPLLASSATVLLVVYSSHHRPRRRRKLRRGLQNFSYQAAATGVMVSGTDLTVNAVELPVGSQDQLVAERLEQYLRHPRSKLPNGTVIDAGDLGRQSLSEALIGDCF